MLMPHFCHNFQTLTDISKLTQVIVSSRYPLVKYHLRINILFISGYIYLYIHVQ